MEQNLVQLSNLINAFNGDDKHLDFIRPDGVRIALYNIRALTQAVLICDIYYTVKVKEPSKLWRLRYEEPMIIDNFIKTLKENYKNSLNLLKNYVSNSIVSGSDLTEQVGWNKDLLEIYYESKKRIKAIPEHEKKKRIRLFKKPWFKY